MFDLGAGVSLTGMLQEVNWEDLSVLALSGIDTFELNPVNFATDYDHAVRDAFRTMLNRTGKRAYSYHVPFFGRDDLSSTEETLRKRAISRFRSHLHDVRFFRCRIVVTHPSTELDCRTDHDAHVAALRLSMTELEAELKQDNLKLALELLPRWCLGNSETEILRLLDGFDDTFGCCFDSNHQMGRYRELPGIIRMLGARLIATHLSDYDGIDECHWLPGQGVIDWRAVLDTLREIDYRGPFNYEIRRNESCPLPFRLQMVEQNFHWMRSLSPV